MILISTLMLTSLWAPSLEVRLAAIEQTVQGRLGAAIITPHSQTYSRKGERFSVQSVMKLVVAMASLDQVDQGKWKRGQKFLYRKSDGSVSVQPLAEKLGSRTEMTTTLEECIELTVTESCSASGDFLIRKMGGIHRINAFLRKRGIRGLSIDRQERDLQSNIAGLWWKPEYVDPVKFESAADAVPSAHADAAYRRYLVDVRDTTTPEAMGELLTQFAKYNLLSKRSTDYLFEVMTRTQTGQNRLKAGVTAPWQLGHKTGTSSSRNGISCATNDVGIARDGKGNWVVIVALVGDSTAGYEDREHAIAQVARVAFSATSPAHTTRNN